MKRIKDTTPLKVFNRMAAWFQLATEAELREGLEWYTEAQQFVEYLARHNRLDPLTVAAVVSALSPQNKWHRNMIDAMAVIDCWVAGGNRHEVTVCTYPANKDKAFALLDNGASIDKVSIKTWNFAHNVGMLSSDHITVDLWMARAGLTMPNEGKVDCQETFTPKQYEMFAAAIRKLAQRHGFKGYEMQAILWIVIRNRWN